MVVIVAPPSRRLSILLTDFHIEKCRPKQDTPERSWRVLARGSYLLLPTWLHKWSSFTKRRLFFANTKRFEHPKSLQMDQVSESGVIEKTSPRGKMDKGAWQGQYFPALGQSVIASGIETNPE
uniref:Uncharacterized protein n=1 Tax=Candidatus Kentrum sp. LFY TaxID=2126342 RepID=A0A450WRI0_9GAMM|nr:MAG: hypothetical protein BECKLFY1418C_GA0070996_10618 [Candidatus Kentron sp. LFY]